MSKIILISQPEPRVLEMLDKEFYTADLKGKLFAYLPCEGDNPDNPKYTSGWQNKVEKLGGRFEFIDNSKSYEKSEKERKIVETADYLFIPGGNSFKLLNNLRKSGLFNSVKELFKNRNVVYCGMSAGALILAPTIESANDGYLIINH